MSKAAATTPSGRMKASGSQPMIGSFNQMLEALPNTTAAERKAMRARAVRQLGVCNQAAGAAASRLIKAIDAFEAGQG